MKNFTRPLWGILLSLAAVFLGGCASMGATDSFATQTMTNKEYMGLSAEGKTKYLKAVATEAELSAQKEAVEYLAGRPIYTGNAKTARTIQWDRIANIAYVYPGHNPDGMGVETYGAMGFATDNKGVVKLKPDGTHMTVFLNVAAQEDMTRTVLKTFATAVPSAFNGAIAAHIQSNACKGGCGGAAGIVNYNLANAGSSSGAAASIEEHGCSTCGLPPSGP